ncbi:hypothetical protein OIV83_000530 [Microbotryomycetes sp. JL201]|nr:hypothetical protein OIV83_000530 [Microbotryomycetes sp. JL201]
MRRVWPLGLGIIHSKHEADPDVLNVLSDLGVTATVVSVDSDLMTACNRDVVTSFIYPDRANRAMPWAVVSLDELGIQLNRHQTIVASTLVGNDGHPGITKITWDVVFEDVSLSSGMTLHHVLALQPQFVGPALISGGWLDRIRARDREQVRKQLKGLAYQLDRHFALWNDLGMRTYRLAPATVEQHGRAGPRAVGDDRVRTIPETHPRAPAVAASTILPRFSTMHSRVWTSIAADFPSYSATAAILRRLRRVVRLHSGNVCQS